MGTEITNPNLGKELMRHTLGILVLMSVLVPAAGSKEPPEHRWTVSVEEGLEPYVKQVAEQSPAFKDLLTNHGVRASFRWGACLQDIRVEPACYDQTRDTVWIAPGSLEFDKSLRTARVLSHGLYHSHEWSVKKDVWADYCDPDLPRDLRHCEIDADNFAAAVEQQMISHCSLWWVRIVHGRACKFATW